MRIAGGLWYSEAGIEAGAAAFFTVALFVAFTAVYYFLLAAAVDYCADYELPAGVFLPA